VRSGLSSFVESVCVRFVPASIRSVAKKGCCYYFRLQRSSPSELFLPLAELRSPPLARRQRGRTDHRVSEPQIARRHFGSEIFPARFDRSCPLSLCPGTNRGETQEPDHKLFPACFPAPLCPERKLTEGTAEAYKICKGRLWPHMATSSCNTWTFLVYHGLVWLAGVHGS